MSLSLCIVNGRYVEFWPGDAASHVEMWGNTTPDVKQTHPHVPELSSEIPKNAKQPHGVHRKNCK